MMLGYEKSERLKKSTSLAGFLSTFIMNMFKIKLKCKLRRYRPTLNQRVVLFIRDELNFKIGSSIKIVKERANIDVLRFLQKTF